MTNTLHVGVLAQARSLFRAPITVGLILVLPLVGIELYGVSLASFPPSMFAELAIEPATKGRLSGAIFATATIAGVLGLFQMISARDTDDRLVRCGKHRLVLVGNRVLTVGLVSVVVAVVSLATLSWRSGLPHSILGAAVVLVGIGLLYSLLGILLGSLLPRKLEGSLLLITLADVDNIFASGVVPIQTDLPTYFPLYHPHQLFQAMYVDGTPADADIRGMALALAALGALTLVVYLWTTKGGET